jgi:hypothetical protein
MELTIAQLIAVFGIPSAITGLAIWWMKRKVEQNERKSKEHDENLEALVLMMMQTSRANTVGITAIARAIQRIPDAKCNGDMTTALEQMEAIQKKEQQFVMDKGIKYLFE